MAISENRDPTPSLFRQQTCHLAVLVCRLLECCLLPAVLVSGVQGCDDQWFGKDCRIQCHCRNGCLSTGECVGNSGCRDGYFGLGCQYVDLFFFHGNGNPMFLADKSDSTCNPNSTSRKLTVRLDTYFRLSWLVLHVSAVDLIFTPEIRINGLANSCFKKKVFTDNNTIHIFCRSLTIMALFEIRGFIVPFICSIKISGGRSLAHVSKETGRNGSLLNSITDTENCTISPDGIKDNQWNLTFSDMVLLRKVRVYQRRNYTLQGFVLSLMSYMDEVLNVYHYASNVPDPYVDLPITTSEPIESINFHAKKILDPGERFMYLCKVEVYGDVMCPVNTYGIQCEHTCSCSSPDVCQTTTGMCSGPCPSGFYGIRCKQRCPVHCAKNTCQQSSGECFQCSPGYMGGRCQDECPANKYGNRCESTCSAFCGYESCDNVSGNCSKCTGGRTGSHCRECPIGKFGIGCSQTCSPYCKNTTCDSESGRCTACRDGHVGDTCKECPPGTYGNKCSYPCPEHCAADVCSFDSGHCVNCDVGYSGMRCEALYEHDELAENGWLYGSVLAIFVFFSLVFMFLVREKKPLSTHRSGEE